MDDFEERYKDAVEAGQRNLRAAKLVSNWCFHAEINRSGGRGLIEAETGLPIGHMGLQCKHSKKNSMHSWLLEDAAYDFYLNNCKNCSERTAVGLPNIMEFVAPREEAAKARRLKRETDEAKREAQRKSREEKRALLRHELELDETFVLDLVDELDRDEVSGDDPRLEKLADLAPETFTRRIVDLLLPDVLHEHLPYSIPAAKALLRASIEDAEKVAVAVRLVGAYEQSPAAVDVVLNNSGKLSGDDLKKVLHRFTHLALGPPPGMHVGGSKPVRLDASPVQTLYAKRTGDIREVVGTLINDTNSGKIGAAVEIILAVNDDQLLLEHSRTVFAKLMRRRTLLSNERHDSSVLYYLREAASRCLDHFPEETDRIIQSFLADRDKVGEGEAFRTYRSVLKHAYREKVIIGEAQRIAFKRLLWAAVTNPERRMDDATQFFQHSWDEFAPLAVQHFDDLIGAAATLSEKYEAVGEENALGTVNDTLAELERRNKRTTIDSLQGALIAWAALGAKSKGREGIEEFLSLYRRLPEGQVQMRGNMIAHVSELLTGVQSLNLILSDWYRALMDENALVRASAVQAWETVPYELIQHFPDLFFEAFAVSLTDPYVIVHKSAIRVLRRRSIPKEKRGLVQGGIWNLILHYANESKTSDFTVDCIDVLECLCMTKGELRGRFGEILSGILLSLEEGALYRAVDRLYLSFLHAPGFVKVALKALQDDYTRSISTDDCETTILRAPSDELEKCIDELQAAFETFAPFRVEDFRTLLVLASACSRAGRFDIGAARFKQISEEIPDDDRNKLWRLETAMIAAAFEFERAIGEDEYIVDISENWGGLTAELEKENEERANLRDFPPSFLFEG